VTRASKSERVANEAEVMAKGWNLEVLEEELMAEREIVQTAETSKRQEARSLRISSTPITWDKFLDYVKRITETTPALLGGNRMQQQINMLISIFSTLSGGVDNQQLMSGDGVFYVSNLRKCMKNLAIDVNSNELEVEFMRCGGDGSLANFGNMVCNTKPMRELLWYFKGARSLKSAYTLFDESGDGGVDANEFGNTLTKLFGWRPTRFETDKLMKLGDPDGDGEISFPEFVVMITSQLSGRTGRTLNAVRRSIDEYQEQFWAFDVSNENRLDFVITVTEFIKVIIEDRESRERRVFLNPVLTWKSCFRFWSAWVWTIPRSRRLFLSLRLSL